MFRDLYWEKVLLTVFVFIIFWSIKSKTFQRYLPVHTQINVQGFVQPAHSNRKVMIFFFVKEARPGGVCRRPLVSQGSTADMKVITELCLDLDPGKQAGSDGKL